MFGFVLIGLCVLSVVLAVALGLACYALVSAKTQLGLEIGRRGDQEALNEARRQALDAQRETLRREFGELAARLLNDNQQNLVASNAKSVEGLFAQLKENLSKYEKEVEKAAGENTRLGEHMRTQLLSLQNFADEARRFTAALVGGNKLQGNQGEMILAGIFEQSGFVRGVHFDMQQGGRDEGRPDACVYDALNKRVMLIDAKMNIKDFIEAYNLPDDSAHREAKDRALKKHVDSIRSQIRNLAAKDYASSVTSKRDGYEILPLVAMFCPFDAVLEAALKIDPKLMQFAYENNVALVTPLTLWGYFRLVSWGWKQQAIEGKFEEVKKQGGEVLSALDAALNDLVEMGNALHKANDAYETLYNRMTAEKGKPSIVRVARKLQECGVQVQKAKQVDKLTTKA